MKMAVFSAQRYDELGDHKAADTLRGRLEDLEAKDEAAPEPAEHAEDEHEAEVPEPVQT